MSESHKLVWSYLRSGRASLAGLMGLMVMTIFCQILTPVLVARFIDRALDGAPLRALGALAASATAVSLLAQVMIVAETWAAERLGWSMTNALRLDLATHLLRLDYVFHLAHSQGELIERVDGDPGKLARFFSSFIVNVLGNGLLILGILSVLLVIDWPIGLGMLLLTLIALGSMLAIQRQARPAWFRSRAVSAEVYGFLGEYLDGLEDIRSSGRSAQQLVLRGFARLLRLWLTVTLRAERWAYALMATSHGLFSLGIAFALGMAALRYRSGALTIGTVFLVVRLADMLREPTDRLREEVQDFQQAAAALDRVRSLLAEQPQIVDGPGGVLPPGPLAVTFDRVSVAYGRGEPVVRDCSLTIAPGRVLGLIGRTGSGKSTLARCIPRLIDPVSGRVAIGGIDARQLKLHDLRSRIGFVSQDVQLFDASLRDNLTLFQSSDSVQDECLANALDEIGLGKWWRALPNGLDTLLGAGGLGLSAGEAQLIGCARVLVRAPDIVVLDEASARLDPATEHILQRAIGRVITGRTALLIAHRLDTLAFADDIAVLVDGELLEYGSRLELAANPVSRYAELLRLDTPELLQ